VSEFGSRPAKGHSAAAALPVHTRAAHENSRRGDPVPTSVPLQPEPVGSAPPEGRISRGRPLVAELEMFAVEQPTLSDRTDPPGANGMRSLASARAHRTMIVPDIIVP
jgi:hypothetical protein